MLLGRKGVLPVRLIFSLLIFLCCFQAALNPLRLFSVFNMAYLNLGIIYFSGLLCFVFYLYRIRMQTILEFILVVFVLMGLMYALTTENDPFKIFTGFIRPLFFLAVIKFFSFGFDALNKHDLFREREANLLLISFVVGVSTVAFVYFTVGGVRASATSIILALPFLFFIFNKCYVRAVLCVILFLVGGKLGPFVGVLAALSLVFLSSLRQFLFFTLFLAILSLVVLVLNYTSDIDFLRIPVLAKLNIKSIIDGDISNYNLDRLVLGGRLSEAYSAITGISPDYGVLDWMFGGGLGYTYLWTDFNGFVIREDNSGVHFSPLAVFCVYGLPFTILFFLYLGKYLLQSISILMSSRRYERASVIWAAFFVASCVNALTAYSLFTNLMMAVSIGFLQKQTRDKKCLKIERRINLNTSIKLEKK